MNCLILMANSTDIMQEMQTTGRGSIFSGRYLWMPPHDHSLLLHISFFFSFSPSSSVHLHLRSAVTKEIKLVPLNFVGMWVGRVAGRAL